MKRFKTLIMYSLLGLIGSYSGSITLLNAQMVTQDLTIPEEQTLSLPGLVMKYKIPLDFRKRGDLQNKVLKELTEDNIRSPKRLLLGFNAGNAETKGPIGIGYKGCFLRLGKNIRLKSATVPEEIEKCSNRLTMSIGRRSAFEQPLRSLDVLYQNAPIRSDLEYKFYDLGNYKLLAAHTRLPANSLEMITYSSEDDIRNTSYFYKILDEDTYLEISHEGPINKEDLNTLLLSILDSIELTSKRLLPLTETRKEGTQENNRILKFFIEGPKTYPTGAGDNTKLGEKILVSSKRDQERGTYLLDSYRLNFVIDETGEIIPRPTYTYKKRSKDLSVLLDKVLVLEYEYPENIQNLKRVEIKSLFDDGRIDNSSIVNGGFSLTYTDTKGVNRGILIIDSAPTSPPPEELPLF